MYQILGCKFSFLPLRSVHKKTSVIKRSFSLSISSFSYEVWENTRAKKNTIRRFCASPSVAHGYAQNQLKNKKKDIFLQHSSHLRYSGYTIFQKFIQYMSDVDTLYVKSISRKCQKWMHYVPEVYPLYTKSGYISDI